MLGLVGVGKRRTTGAGGTGTRTRVVPTDDEDLSSDEERECE